MEAVRGKKIGYLCTFTPKELIWAAGFLPVRILAKNQPVSLANSHLQTYSCSQARGSLERLLKGELDLAGVIFTRSCDTLMRLADVWEKNSAMRVYNLEFPTKIRDSTLDFFKRELYDLKSTMEEWSGRRIGREELITSIRLYGELERTLKELFEAQPDYEIVLKAQSHKPDEVLKEAKNRLSEVRGSERDRGRKVLVTGSVCPFLEITDLIADAGFSIIDDLCTGTRFFTFETPKNESEIASIDDAMEFLARKYFLKAPCPTKNYENDGRFSYLLERAKDVDAVIFLLMKFCEPHFFDYPQLKEKLEAMGKKTLLLELEFPVSPEQLRTRIEAFYETL